MRTSVVLAIVALLLLGYIVFVDRGKLSSGELDQRKGTALPELVRARVEKIEIQQKGQTTVLARDLQGEDEAGLWRVEAPYRAEADQDAVDTLLGELEWLDGRRNLGPVNADDQKRFGFDKPRIRVWFTVGAKRVPVIVGGESTRGDGVYVQAGDPPQAMIAGKDLIEGLRQEPGHFHTKTLHEGMLVSTTSAIELRDAQGSRGVTKRADELWGLLPDAKRLASTEVVQQLVDALDGLRATRFVGEAKGDLARYGLDAPRLVVHVKATKLASTKPDGAQGKAGAGAAGAGSSPKPLREATSFELRVGNACAGHAGESHVMLGSTGKVLCASDADLDKLQKSPEGLREARLLPFAEDDLASARVEHGGKLLTLTDEDGVFSYELTAGGKRVAQGVAREGSVQDWLKALAAVQASQLDAGDPSAVAAGSAIALSFGRHGDKPPFALRALASATELLARRGDEPGVAAFPPSALELLDAQVARFRPLRVLELAEPSIRGLAIERGGTTERIVRGGKEGFRIEAPVAAAADPVLVPELTRLLAALHAERYVADAARPEHGLSTPFAVLRVEHVASGKPDAPTGGGTTQTTTLTLGAETVGGRFAQKSGDAAVFVVSRQLVDLVGSPLTDRAALATPLEQLSEALVTRDETRVRIVRQGDSFVGAEPADLPQTAARALAETIATLRATRVAGYAAGDPSFGFAKPFATLAITIGAQSGTATTHTLLLGADAGEGARYARRAEQSAVLVLSRETVERLTDPAKPR